MIVQIGACYFDRMTGEIGDTFSVNVIYGARGDAFSIDYHTVKWWLEQSQEARESILKDPVPIEVALRDLKDFLDRDDTLLWSHATFDMPILQNAFEQTGWKNPVPFRNMRDLRTLMDLADLSKMKRERFGIHHNALDDAKFQASYAADAFVAIHARTTS